MDETDLIQQAEYYAGSHTVTLGETNDVYCSNDCISVKGTRDEIQAMIVRLIKHMASLLDEPAKTVFISFIRNEISQISNLPPKDKAQNVKKPAPNAFSIFITIVNIAAVLLMIFGK